MKLLIKKKTNKPFDGADGERRDYFWYLGQDQNGLVKRFGSSDGSHQEGETYDLNIEEYEQSNGRKGLKEVKFE